MRLVEEDLEVQGHTEELQEDPQKVAISTKASGSSSQMSWKGFPSAGEVGAGCSTTHHPFLFLQHKKNLQYDIKDK